MCIRDRTYPLLMREKGSGTREMTDRILAEKGISCDIRWECSNTQTPVSYTHLGEVASSLPFFQPLQNLLISRAEIKFPDFRRGDPLQVHMLQFLWNTCGNSGVEQCQVYRQVWIFVGHFHEHIPYGKGKDVYKRQLPKKKAVSHSTG